MLITKWRIIFTQQAYY